MGATRPFRQAVKCGAATIASAMSKPIVAAACAALAVAFLAFGASGATYYRPSAQAVIAAALRSPSVGAGAVYFRRTRGGQRCVLHGGGPPPGTTAVKTCWTDVWVRRDGSARVRLMISPPYTKLGKGQTWVFRVSRSLRVKLLRPPTNLGIWGQA